MYKLGNVVAEYIVMQWRYTIHVVMGIVIVVVALGFILPSQSGLNVSEERQHVIEEWWKMNEEGTSAWVKQEERLNQGLAIVRSNHKETALVTTKEWEDAYTPPGYYR